MGDSSDFRMGQLISIVTWLLFFVTALACFQTDLLTLFDDIEAQTRNNRRLCPHRLPSHLWQCGQAQFCFKERKPGSANVRGPRDFRAASSS